MAGDETTWTKAASPTAIQMPILRRESTFKAIVDYNKKMAEEVTS